MWRCSKPRLALDLSVASRYSRASERQETVRKPGPQAGRAQALRAKADALKPRKRIERKDLAKHRGGHLLASGAGGPGFESPRPDHSFQQLSPSHFPILVSDSVKMRRF